MAVERRPSRGAVAVERVRGEHPDDPSWRADALAASRHSRLLDELRMPLEDHDPERAELLCAEVARIALRDYSPALILLPAALRRRAQALAAYTLTLLDFAGQRGLEGERLAQINRWEFNLELALDGRPPGQPIFVRMAREEGFKPWSREALDQIAEAARRLALRDSGTGLGETETRRLAEALAASLVEEPAPELGELGAVLLRSRALIDGWPPSRSGGSVAGECAALRSLLERAGAASEAVPDELRRAASYLRRAARALVGRVERAGGGSHGPPSLGVGTRIGLLLLSRLGL